MDLEETRELYGFLQNGPPPDGYYLNETPKLSADCAFSIIYLLQEHYGIIPPYNKCMVCGDLYDGTGAESDTAMIDVVAMAEQDDDIQQKTLDLMDEYNGYEFCSPECMWDFWTRKLNDKTNNNAQ